ncbi:TetR/AcrR family transcriptional regulator [Nocardia sp. NPDC057353]|uniref:TetR/AcrR family transcriptional regulator n=1 Tax=Nocardia sp. NPDC057353 TaxID=3346104 RepID=UPI0036370BE6
MSSANSPWLRAEQVRPGPRPAHTLDDIAAACVRIADESGLAAVAMRRVAERLGTAAASLYRYVDGKDDLFALMVDHVAAEYELAPLTGDVRADVLAVAEEARALHRRHPWVQRVSPSALGPNSLRYLDHLVGALGPAGLDRTTVMVGIAQLTGWISTFAAQESAGAVAAGQDPAALPAMVARGDYPHLTALFAGAPAPGSGFDADAAFRAGIDALLFGIAGQGR